MKQTNTMNKLTLMTLVGMAICSGSITKAVEPEWTSELSPRPGRQLFNVWGSSPSNVFAVGIDGTILHYNGLAWSTMTSEMQNLEDMEDLLQGLWGSGPSDVFAVGEYGTILHYDGSVWSTMTSGTATLLFDIWGSGPSDVFAVGYNGMILHYDGSVWSKMTSGTTTLLFDIWGSGPSDVFAACENGMILHYDGLSWSQMSSGLTTPILGIWGSGPSDVFAVGLYGKILHYNGSTWSAMTSGTEDSLFSVWGSGPSDVFVGSRNMILHYDGSTWSKITFNMQSGSALRSIWGSSTANIFAVTSDGTILNYQVTGILSVDTTPVQGEVLVDGISLGTTPQSKAITIGSHMVSFGEVDGYIKPADQTITVEKDSTVNVTGNYEEKTMTGACSYSGLMLIVSILLAELWLTGMKIKE